jgi:hypothetical protein
MATMYRSLSFSIKGTYPLMFHNGRLADPLNHYAKAMKEITSKRKKTDADHQALYDLEWEGSLYVNDQNQVIIPGINIEAAFIEGAKKQRLGPAFKAGFLCDEDFPLKHDGPKDIEKLKSMDRFRDKRGVKVNGSRVIRCRPIFGSGNGWWGLDFTVQYLPDVLNESQVRSTLDIIGRLVGLGDHKPKYGRFEVLTGAKTAAA